jgi:uncharacterized protein YjbI with pentapeptide repeats
MSTVRELVDLPFASLLVEHTGELAADQDYDTVHFARREFTAATASHSHFTECAFTSVTFNEGRFRRSRFNDVWMDTLRLVGTDLAETDWLDSTVRSSMLAGVTAFSSQLRRVVFQGCKFNAVNFRASEFTDVTFQDCVLQEVDLNNAKLTKVAFPGTTLDQVHMDKATLAKVDFRGASELNLASGYDALHRAVINTGQLTQLAPILAEWLGITVKD